MRQLFIAMVFSVAAFGQKIQIKKDKIVFDKVEIATINEPYRDHYDFSTLSGEKKFSVDFKGLNVNATQFYQWLEVTSADGKQKTEIPHDVLITAFDVKRIIAHNLSVKYNLIDAKGINDAALQTFFETSRESLSEKYGKIVAASKFEADEQKRKILQVKNQYNPQIQNDKSITFYFNGKMTIVGRMTANPYVVGGGPTTYVYVTDIDGNQVASLASTKSFDNYAVTTFDGNNYEYYTKSMYSHTNSTFLYEFLCDLVARGYTLGHQARDEKNKLLQAKVNLAKERSVNIYKRKGYIIDEDGKRLEGIISVNFQMLDVNETGKILPEETADKFGKTVVITYFNEKKQERTKTFKASSKVYFCLTDGAAPVFYYGMPVKGDSMKKMQNMTNLSFDNSYFYQLIHKEDKVMLLQDPVETDRYVFKIPAEDKGQMIDKRSTEALIPVVAEYLKSCKAVVADLKANQFDLKNEANLINIAKEFQNCK